MLNINSFIGEDDENKEFKIMRTNIKRCAHMTFLYKKSELKINVRTKMNYQK